MYNLPELAARTKDIVIVVEGEKAADAAIRLLPDYVVTTSSGGSKAAHKSDWSPLKGRDVIIWPDADEAGTFYCNSVGKALEQVGASSVKRVSNPADVAEGWDAADAEEAGWSQEQLAQLISTAANVPNVERGNQLEQGRGRRSSKGSAHDELLLQFSREYELWHCPNKEAYITIDFGEHRENWPLKSGDVRDWFENRFFVEFGEPVNERKLEAHLRLLDAIAKFNGDCYVPVRRVGSHGGLHYLDLADDKWQAVEVDGNGWRVIQDPPVKFVRDRSIRSLPIPNAKGSINYLRQFLNISNEDDFVIIVAWLLAAMRDAQAYPILMLSGEQGTAKSTLMRMLRSLVDPNQAVARSLPKDERDLVVSATHSWILSFDNVSYVTPDMSDALCKMATGSGFAIRRLYTDAEEYVFDGQRPIIVNGIPTQTGRPDLASRSFFVELQVIDNNHRETAQRLMAAFEEAQPYIIGALLNGISSAIRNLPTVETEFIGRMPDVEEWVAAAEEGLGWSPGTFNAAYKRKTELAALDMVEMSPLAETIKGYMAEKNLDVWQDTATGQLAELRKWVTWESDKRYLELPKTPAAYGTAVKRIAGSMRQAGFKVETGHRVARWIRFTAPEVA